MKTKPITFALIALTGMTLSVFAENTLPAEPAGHLSAYPTVVKSGTKPTLTWAIMYPSKVSNIAAIIPPGTIKLIKDSYVSVSPISTDTKTAEGAATPSEFRMSVNGGAYKQLFYGTQADVSPIYSLYVKKLTADTVINFGGRYVVNGAWSPFYTTNSGNYHVVALVNGSTPPTRVTLTGEAKVAAGLKPYLDDGGRVKISPMSVLILMELKETNRASNDFDYQDQAFMVTFSPKHPNNGHGNNLDGVDSSNPGKGSGGPNGAVDPSGGVDDEAK